ncbi:MAG: hypothetical protein ACTHZ9_12370 [Leucobacter sp.]
MVGARLAAAIATPMASASTTPQALLDLNAGCIQVAGVSLFPGFSVNNVGDDTGQAAPLPLLRRSTLLE